MKYKEIDIKNLAKKPMKTEDHTLIAINKFLVANYENIDVNTRIKDLFNLCKGEEEFQEIYNEKKSNSSDWKSTLKSWIKQINKDVKDNRTNSGQDFIYPNQILIGLSYLNLISGDNPPLHEYASYMTEFSKDEKGKTIQIFREKCFQSILLGVIYSFKLKRLKSEYDNLLGKKKSYLESRSSLPIASNNLNIVWHGEVKRDLAYIFWQLKQKELIECKDLGDILSQIFWHKNNPIKNTYFNAEFAKFKKGEMPNNAIELDKILLKPAKTIKKLE